MAEQQDERSIPSFPFVSNPAHAMKHLSFPSLTCARGGAWRQKPSRTTKRHRRQMRRWVPMLRASNSIRAAKKATDTGCFVGIPCSVRSCARTRCASAQSSGRSRRWRRPRRFCLRSLQKRTTLSSRTRDLRVRTRTMQMTGKVARHLASQCPTKT